MRERKYLRGSNNGGFFIEEILKRPTGKLKLFDKVVGDTEVVGVSFNGSVGKGERGAGEEKASVLLGKIVGAVDERIAVATKERSIFAAEEEGPLLLKSWRD